jgi:hypothetical protein
MDLQDPGTETELTDALVNIAKHDPTKSILFTSGGFVLKIYLRKASQFLRFTERPVEKIFMKVILSIPQKC